MAVPDSITLRNFTGTYGLNKTLSDPMDPVLQMQGIGWLVRKAVQVSNVTLQVTQYTDPEGSIHIDITSTSTGNIRNLETRTIDNVLREKDDKIFGKVRGRTRFVFLDTVTDGYLKEGWVGDPKQNPEVGTEVGTEVGIEVVESYVQSLGKKPEWTAEQIWGFSIVEGGRRHVRRLIVRKGEEVHRVRLVYDWIG